MPADLDAKVDDFFSGTMEKDLCSKGCAALSTVKREDLYEILKAKGYSIVHSSDKPLHARVTDGGIDLFAEQNVANFKDGFSYVRIEGPNILSLYDQFRNAYVNERKTNDGNYELAALLGGTGGVIVTLMGIAALFEPNITAKGEMIAFGTAAVLASPIIPYVRMRSKARKTLKEFNPISNPYQAICAALGYQPKIDTKAA